MIVSKSQVGSFKRGGVFNHNRQALIPQNQNIQEYILDNGLCTFVFRREPTVGVYLYSFKEKDGITYYNKSKSLWKIGITRFFDYVSLAGTTYEDSYVLHPTSTYFDTNAAVATSTSGKSISFRWVNIPFDRSNSLKTINVTLTCFVPAGSKQLEFSITLRDTSGLIDDAYALGDVIQSVAFPSIAVEKDADDEEEDMFVCGAQMGEAIKNPIKNFESPRWNNEALQYKQYYPDNQTEVYKFYKGGQPVGALPTTNLKILNLGSPGWLYTPLAVFGNRTSKNCFLYYALDQDGSHAKNFQAYSDGKTLNFRFWDLSDEVLSSNGVGGSIDNQDNNDLYLTRVNSPKWKTVLRPFKSPTRWVEWESIYLYKEEAIPVLEEYGWMAKPFYQRYQNNSAALSDLEIPFYFITVGHQSGDADDINQAVEYYRSWYSGMSTSSVVPRMYTHVQETVLSAAPLTGQDQMYFGWVPWATGSKGPDAYKSPDVYLNPIYSGSNYTGVQSGNTNIYYQIFPYVITSGSEWTIENNAIDLAGKRLSNRNQTYTNASYNAYATGESHDFGIFSSSVSYNACFDPEICKDKYLEMASGLAINRAGLYNDTAGLHGGKGCYATNHIYQDLDGNEVIITHPRALFSHYFNSKQHTWLSEEYAQRTSISGLIDVVDSTTPNELLGGAEYQPDSLIKYTPAHIPIDFASPLQFKTYFRTVSDPPRTDFISEASLIPGILNFGFIKKRPYQLSVPVHQILYGDRTIASNWAGPALGNILDASGIYVNVGPLSGYDETNTRINRDLTEAERIQEFRHLATTSHNYFSRFSVQHQAEDYKNWDEIALMTGTNARFSGLNLPVDHSVILESATWSGYTNYVENFIKLQANEPDYLYHGTIQHPFDSYAVDTLDAGFSINVIRDSRPNFSESSGNLEEVIYHSVRRHRERTSFLITFANWTSGDYVFSGQFEPLSYNMINAYDIYSLDLTGSPVTKTKVDTKSIDESYEFNFTLSGSSVVAYEIQQLETLLTSDFANFTSDYVNIRYGYSQKQLVTANFGVSYSYGDFCEGTVNTAYEGYKAAATQEIMNNLPPWMEMRKNQNSTGWTLLNSWGQSFEEVLGYSSDKILDLHLETADETQISRKYTFEVDEDKLFNAVETRNLLLNSSFSILDIARYNLPAGWTDNGRSTQSITLNDRDVFIGTRSVMFNTTGNLTQTVELNSYVDSITASIYCKSNELDTDIRLIVTAELIDGTFISNEASIVSKSLEWKRLVLPVFIRNDVYRIHYTIRATANTKVCSPQLEFGEKQSDWTKNEFDSLPYLRPLRRLNNVLVEYKDVEKRKIPVYGLQEESEFFNIDIPTRIEKENIPYNQHDFRKNQLFGRRVTYEGERIPTQWIITERKVSEVSTIPGPYDVFERYDLVELRYFSDGIYGYKNDCEVTITPIDTLIRSRLLYILCKEEYRGETYYTIKLTRPLTPVGQNTYLKIISDIKLEIQNNDIYNINQIIEEPTSLVISNKDPNIIGVNTNTLNRHYYRLYFDYYFFDNRRGTIYSLENYKESNIRVL